MILLMFDNYVVNVFLWASIMMKQMMHGIIVSSIVFFLKTHTLHGTDIFTYIYHKNQPNVGNYTM